MTEEIIEQIANLITEASLEAKEQEERCNRMRTEFSNIKNTLATFEKNAEDFYKRFREQEVRAIKAEEIINQIANLIIEASLEAEEQDLDIPRRIAEVLVTRNIIKDNLTLSSFIH